MDNRPADTVDATSMTPRQLAAVLSRASATEVDAAAIEADLAAGAPCNADGKVNLVHYAAWLLHESRGRGRGDGGA
jgi:hypothetical protein